MEDKNRWPAWKKIIFPLTVCSFYKMESWGRQRNSVVEKSIALSLLRFLSTCRHSLLLPPSSLHSRIRDYFFHTKICDVCTKENTFWAKSRPSSKHFGRISSTHDCREQKEGGEGWRSRGIIKKMIIIVDLSEVGLSFNSMTLQTVCLGRDISWTVVLIHNQTLSCQAQYNTWE